MTKIHCTTCEAVAVPQCICANCKAPLRQVDDPAPVSHARVWQPMCDAPTDGKHCILAIKTGAFVYSIQGSFMNGKWMNAADIDAEPLCWMPNFLIPDEFLPWKNAAASEGSTDDTI